MKNKRSASSINMLKTFQALELEEVRRLPAKGFQMPSIALTSRDRSVLTGTNWQSKKDFMIKRPGKQQETLKSLDRDLEVDLELPDQSEIAIGGNSLFGD